MSPATSKKMELGEEIDWSVVIIIIIGTFMAILDSSIVNVALPKMMAVFGANVNTITWVVTAYMLTLGVVMPLSGWLGDTLGYKRCYFFALALFVAGSTLCGLAHSMDTLIAARVIQAMGGGILTPLGMAIIYKVCPRNRIGTVIGVWGISSMAAPAIGPTLGGYLVQYVDWRMIFFINVPVGIINLFLVYTNLGESDLIKGKQFDLLGIIFSSIGFFCLLLASSEGLTDGWSSPFIVGLLTFSAVSLFAFIINELGHPEPILQLRLFQNTVFAIANVLSSILAVGLFGVTFLMPILLQDILGQTPLKSGLIVFPAAIASGLIMPFSGWFFDRHGARGIVIAGVTIVTVTTFMMRSFNDLTAFTYMTELLMVRGVGLGLAMMPVMNVGMNAVPPHLVGRASAALNQVRQVSASFGIAILTTIMSNRQVLHAGNLAESVNLSGNAGLPLRANMQALLLHMGLSAAFSQYLGLGLIYLRMEYLSTIQAIDDCYMVAAGLCLCGLVMAFFLKDKSLHSARMEAARGEAEETVHQEEMAFEV